MGGWLVVCVGGGWWPPVVGFGDSTCTDNTHADYKNVSTYPDLLMRTG